MTSAAQNSFVVDKPSNRWIWKVVAMSVLISFLISWLNLQQNLTSQKTTNALFNLRQARIDLARGFLHISLAGEPSSPFNVDQGIALVLQAITSFEHASEFDSAKPAMLKLQEDGRQLCQKLQDQNKTGTVNLDRAGLRIALSNLERQAVVLESEVNRNLKEISERLAFNFHFAIAVAVLLLTGICLAVFLIEKQSEQGRWAAEAEREKLQQQLLQAQKLEAVGRLAGGVAHDFNNMLGVMMGYSELAMEQIASPEDVIGCLQEITSAGQRSASLTRQLLAFAKKQPVIPQVLQVNDSIAAMLKMLYKLVGENIALQWAPGKDLWVVKIDPTQLDQLLINLCVNARDAISDIGQISIFTTNLVADSAFCLQHPQLNPGEYVKLAISDNGCGMDKMTLDRVFEPFFTTKGHGTGLGLATVYGIVRQNNGFIEIDSAPGHGSTFSIYLNRHVESYVCEVKKEVVKKVPGGSEIILLVEDDESILEMVKKMLEKYGYQVLTASLPGEAIEIAKTFSGKIALLITDVIMPDMNGKTLAQKIAELLPGVKTLFMSGYTADLVSHSDMIKEGRQFLQKPFSSSELAAKVRRILDQGETQG